MFSDIVQPGYLAILLNNDCPSVAGRVLISQQANNDSYRPQILLRIERRREKSMNIVICHYRVAPGNEHQFEDLLRVHWPTLNRLGLVSPREPEHYRGEEQTGGLIYYEIFEWLPGAVDRAHEHPEVMAVWEPMDTLCEARGPKPNMEFPHVERIHV
jgi:hypothetical protein